MAREAPQFKIISLPHLHIYTRSLIPESFVIEQKELGNIQRWNNKGMHNTAPQDRPHRKVADHAPRGVELVENLLFGVVTLLTFGFAVTLALQAGASWSHIGYLIPFWVVIAYLALPRFHYTMTRLYVPDYFIGRSRTREGLLGDPINLAFNGTQEQIHAVMTAAGWSLADPVTIRSSMKIITSTLTRKSYPNAPVSPLLVFGNSQTLTYQQEVEGNPAQRHHIRLWKCPSGWLLPGGTHVDWVAAGTYDRAVGLSAFTFQITHKIDEEVDIERDYVVETVTRAVPAAGVRVIKNFSTGYHSRNGGGDAIRTDGDLPVIEAGDINPGEYADVAHHCLPLLPGGYSKTENARPLSITGSVVFIVVTALATMVSALLTLNEARGEIAADGLTGPEITATLTAYLVIVMSLNVAMVSLAWKMRQRHRWARFVLLIVVSATQFTHIIPVILGVDFTPESLVSAGAGLLALYALTSRSAREWATQ